MAFGLMEIDSIIIKFEQICAERDMPLLDMRLAIGGHLGNMEIKKLPLGEI